MTTEPKIINAGSSGEWGWHATESALRCPQLFAYHHRIPNIDFGDRPPLLKGSLVHAGLAHYYARLQSAQQRRDPEEWATPDVAIDACAEELGRASLQYVDMAKQVIREYAAHYATDTLTVLHVEEIFTANIGGYKFTQRLDLVARGASGRVFIIDHKGVGRIAGVGKRYALSGQFIGMEFFGREVFGAEFGGVMANLVQLPAKHGDRCEFARVAAEPAPQAQRSFPLTVLHARERIEALDKSGIDPWDWPKTLSEQVCVGLYGPCDGFDLCRWGRP
jgi:hypothetical protein